ncbi:MAG: phosphoribosylanthranilate isomerase [Pseudomonadales bacterium]|nr:phosphoribosylanthranilate isomerase [Pseudomonadales bacterium]
MTECSGTRIKVCGITRPEDAEAVARVGAHALGLNFVVSSPRAVGIATAAEIAGQVEGRLQRIALFADSGIAEVEQVLRSVDIDLLQFHGAEPGALCRSFGLPYMKVVSVGRNPIDLSLLAEEYPDACLLLLDTYIPGQAGGTGRPFDWSLWPQRSPWPLVLAGGLTPDNVEAAIRLTHPFGVDVAGGVEGPVKGVKDPDRLARFVAAVHAADRRDS